MVRRRLWITAGVLTLLSLLSFWAAGSVLAELHEATGEELTQLDAWTMEWVRVRTPRAWAPLLFFLTEMLAVQNLGWLAAAMVLGLGLLWRHGRRYEAVGTAYVLVVAGLGVGIAKLLFQRARPDLDWALASESTFSFPSGHAAHAMALYGMAAYLLTRLTRRWAVGAVSLPLAAFLALATGYSRIYLGVHYPSDVAAGMAVGGIWLVTGIFVTEALHVLARPNLREEAAALAGWAWERGQRLAARTRRRTERWRRLRRAAQPGRRSRSDGVR